MRDIRCLILLLGMTFLAGCAGTTVHDAADTKKAAQLNAELGLNYMSQGKNELAMEKLLKAVDYDAGSVDANHYIAELYKRLERPDKAQEYYKRAISLAPRETAIQNNYGVFLCGEKRYDEGVKYLLQALDNPVWPGREGAFENIGQCLLDKGDTVKAEHYYREALRVNPNLPRSLLAMAEVSLQQQNLISARAFLQRYAAVATHTPQSLWLGIQVERVLGDRNALSSYEMLLRNSFPDTEEAKLYLQSK